MILVTGAGGTVGGEVLKQLRGAGAKVRAAFHSPAKAEKARAQGIDAVRAKHRLDALVALTAGPTWLIDLIDGDHDTGGSSSLAAVAGYPNINVPMGFVRGMPVGISFFGRAWSEPTLIKIAYAFEQVTRRRKPPRFLPTADFTVNS